MELEVGYALLFGEDRTWALCRIPRAAAPSVIDPDASRIGVVECRTGRCAVVAVADHAPSSPESSWVRVRVLRESDDGAEAILVVEPFPIDTPKSVKDDLKLVAGVTKLIRAYYSSKANGELKFDRLEYAGERHKQPLVWK